MTNRDPSIDPQPGDILRGDGKVRRVLKREGHMLICETWGKRYPMQLDTWQEWCQNSDAVTSW